MPNNAFSFFQWKLVATNWKVLSSALILELDFTQSNCQFLFRQGLNQQFCFRSKWFSVHNILPILFFEILICLNCQKFLIKMMLLLDKTSFFPNLTAAFFIKLSRDKLRILNSFQMRNFRFSFSQRKVCWPKIPKLAYGWCGSRDSYSSESKST